MVRGEIPAKEWREFGRQQRPSYEGSQLRALPAVKARQHSAPRPTSGVFGCQLPRFLPVWAPFRCGSTCVAVRGRYSPGIVGVHTWNHADMYSSLLLNKKNSWTAPVGAVLQTMLEFMFQHVCEIAKKERAQRKIEANTNSCCYQHDSNLMVLPATLQKKTASTSRYVLRSWKLN